MSFILRFWLEEGADGRAWRGRVVQVDSPFEAHVEDGSALINLLSRRLLMATGVVFPYVHAPSEK